MMLGVLRTVAMLVLATAPQLVAQSTSASAVELMLHALSATVDGAHDRQLVSSAQRFYARRRFAVAWTDDRGWTRAGQAIQGALLRAPHEGLDSAAYAIAPLDSLTPSALARADVKLSLVALRFAEDLGWGLAVPREVNRENDFPRRPFPADSLLEAWASAQESDRALLAVTPTSPGYLRLREALARLREYAHANLWSRIGVGPSLRRGDTGPRVQELRALLWQRGDLDSADINGETFDETMAGAVARFQERHGLAADSVFGAMSMAAFNVSVDERIQQVQLGMERIRWMPLVDGGRWITVNLADYRAFVFDQGEPVFATRVVIGATNHKSPMFADTLTNIVLNPAWNVPPSITAREIEPKVRRDPTYLDRNHMVRIGRDIQQLPGPWNALGQVAFMFPNRHNVYMHDTPAKELFESPDRAHSHGCIRVQRPHELAELLLQSEGWGRARIDSVIATGQRTVIWLETPIPVRITYATAFADNDGLLQFRRDVYGRDAVLQQVLDREHRRPFPRTRQERE